MARTALLVGGVLLAASVFVLYFVGQPQEHAPSHLRGTEAEAVASRSLSERHRHRHRHYHRGRYGRRYGRRYGYGWGRRRYGYGWGRRRYGYGWYPYRHHRHGWYYWYALPGLEKADKNNLGNADFWHSVFSDPKLLKSFADSVVNMDEASRKAWESSIFASVEEEVGDPNFAVWDAVFGDDAATHRFASWLAEMGEEDRKVWERRVSAAMVDEELPPWQPSWADSWGAKPAPLVAAQWHHGHYGHHGHWGHGHHGHWGHGHHGHWGHGHHGHWGHHGHHHHHGHHGGHWHGWYALPELNVPKEEAAAGEATVQVSNAEFWTKVFSDDDLLDGFATWLGGLGDAARKTWEQRMPTVAKSGGSGTSAADVEEGPLAMLWEEVTETEDNDSTDLAKVKEVERPDLEDAAEDFADGFWQGVFDDDETASSFVAWLAEMSDEERQAWERSVSEAASASAGKTWQPSWPDKWDFGVDSSPEAPAEASEQAAAEAKQGGAPEAAVGGEAPEATAETSDEVAETPVETKEGQAPEAAASSEVPKATAETSEQADQGRN